MNEFTLKNLETNRSSKVKKIEWIWAIIRTHKKEIITVIENDPENIQWKNDWQSWIVFGKKEEWEDTTNTVIREILEETWILCKKNQIQFAWKVALTFPWNNWKKITNKIDIDIANVFINWKNCAKQNHNNQEIKWIEITSIANLIKTWQENNNLIRPWTFESLYTCLNWGNNSFFLDELRDWKYTKEYTQKVLSKLINNIKDIEFIN